MDWAKLLSIDRVGRKQQYKAPLPHRSPWELDTDRIIFSSAFRRLQDKTQVFPLSSSDYVRTRLTHSLEVSRVGRSLGARAGLFLAKSGFLPDHLAPHDIGSIVAAATLGHDIGNPPFGHSGEGSIQKWFTTSAFAEELRRKIPPDQAADIEMYEGNAQGFRILTRLQMYRDEGGMQLTAATMGAFTKYPTASRRPNVNPSHVGVSTKKFGFFQAEREIFEELAESLGLIRREGDEACWARHPLAFLVEAADDICYRIVDLEDTFRQKLVTYKEVEELLFEVITDEDLRKRVQSEPDEDHKVDILRSLAIAVCIDEASIIFEALHNEILTGDFDGDLVSKTRINASFANIKSLQAERAYNNDRVLRVELVGFRVIAGLLDSLVTAANQVSDEEEGRGKAPLDSRKLVALIPTQFLQPGRHLDPDPYLRTMRLLDYVSGMTDSYALTLYRQIVGISLP